MKSRIKKTKDCIFHEYIISAMYFGKKLVAGKIHCKNCNATYTIGADTVELKCKYSQSYDIEFINN